MPLSAPSPQNYSNIIDTTVAQEYLDVNWDLTKRKRVLLEKLDMNGSIKFDGAGTYTEWTAMIGEYQDAYHADLGVRSFARQNHDVRLQAAWSPLEVLGVLSENDVMFANSPTALVDISKKIITRMGEGFYKRINYRLLNENAGSNTYFGIAATGSGSPTQVPLYGLPTIFGYGTAALGYNFATQVSTSIAVAATDKEVLPKTTYCGQNTDPTATISGVSNKIAEALSPVIANWTSTAWNTASGTSWLVNAQDVLEHVITRTSRSTDPDEIPDLCLLTQAMYLQFKQNLRGGSGLQRHVVMTDDSPRSPDPGMHPRVFIPFQGVMCTYDENQPANLGYVLNTKKLNFRMYNDPKLNADTAKLASGGVPRMFTVRQMYDIDQGAYKVVAKMIGQLIGQARYQGAFYNFA